MATRIRRLAYWPMLLLVLLPAAPALGQKDFELDDSDNWKLVGQPDPNTPAGSLARARELLAEGQANAAYNMANRWLARNGDSSLAADAYLLRADALVAMADYYESLYDYEYVIRRYPASPTFTLALARELEIASMFAHGTRRKIFGLRIGDASDEAEEIFIRVQERAPGSQLAEQAGIELADMYFRQSRMELAADMYAIFLEKYPRSPFCDKARRRLIYSNIATFKGPQFDIVGLREAKRELEKLLATRPAEAERIGARALINRITESEATKLLTTAQWYNRTGDPIAAEFYIRNLLERFPRSAATIRALEEIPGILAQLPEVTLQQAPDYELLRQTILNLDRAALASTLPGTALDENGQPIPVDLPATSTEPGLSTPDTAMPPDNSNAVDLDEAMRRQSAPVEVQPGQPTPPSAGDEP
ncbi:MAG: outer membrane protein assembly factor BamD [Phycisphaerales bacterium]|nr:outer membrane protein assembly factor BamD [Phycisphaerales bacterium]